MGKNVTFGGVTPWMKGEIYEYGRELAKEELKYHHEHCQDKPFSQRAKTIGVFNKDKDVYGLDRELPKIDETR